MIIHIRNFGKIESADIDLGNLTIFVGENNSGKTYIMQLIYGLINFFSTKEFNDFLGNFKWKYNSEEIIREILESNDEDISKNILEIKADDRNFYNNFQNALNDFISRNKEKIVEKTFNTRNLSIGSLSIEFGKIVDDLTIQCTKNLKNTSKAKISFHFNKSVNHTITSILFAQNNQYKSMNSIVKKSILTIILLMSFGINQYQLTDLPILYLPASRSGLMLLYTNFLAEYNDDKTFQNDDVVYQVNDGQTSENRYGLTEPIYDFLMFLLKHKTSEMISDKDREIISFINENIINGTMEKTGTTMRYKPALSEHSLPIYLSSSLVSELSPIYQILSGIQKYSFILYDEIETCQHPTKQLQLARLLVRMVNAGYRMVVSTHSDTMAAAINNLITISFKEKKDELMSKLGYEKEDMLESANVKAYQFIIGKDGKTKVEEVKSHFSVGVGFDFDIFNYANDKIYQDAVEIAEVD